MALKTKFGQSGVAIALLLIAVGSLVLVRHLDHRDSDGRLMAIAGLFATKPPHAIPAPAWFDRSTDRRGTVEGVVIDHGGSPVVGAVIAVVPAINLDQADDAGALLPTGVGRSGPAGRFRIDGIRQGQYGVTATAVRSLPAHKSGVIVRSDATTSVELRLGEDGIHLRGRVLDASGGAVPGARLRAAASVSGHGGGSDSTFMFLAMVDADGRYELTLAQGQYTIVAEADGYAPDHALLHLDDGDRIHDFRLQPAALLAGRVVLRGTDEPVAGASVRLEIPGNWMFEPRDARTDPSGVFTFSSVDPGTYEVTARKGALVGVAGRVAVVSAKKADVVVSMDPGHRISGRVRISDGTPLPGAALRIQKVRWDTKGPARATSAQDGSYAVEGVLAERVWLQADAPGRAPVRREVSIGDADLANVDFTLGAEAILIGQVTNRMGIPIGGASVVAVVSESTAMDANALSSGRDLTGEDGSYRIDGLSPGEVRVDADHSSEGRGFGTVRLASETPATLNITLGKGAYVRGVTRWDDGTPAPFSQVQGFIPGKLGQQTIADVNGAYRLGPFEAGQATVIAAAADGHIPWGRAGPAQQAVPLSADEVRSGVDLVVTRTDGAISGVVFGPDGRPLAGATVGADLEFEGRSLRPWTKVDTAPGDQSRIASRDDGSFTLEGLARGVYTVWAEHPGLPEADAHRVQTNASGVRLTFAEGGSVSGHVIGRDKKPVTEFSVGAALAEIADESEERKMVRRAGLSVATQLVHDPSGSFELTALPASTYDIVVTAGATRAARLAGVTVRAGEVRAGLRVVLGAAVTIQGRVVDLDTGTPIASADVNLAAVSDADKLSTATLSDGTFSLKGAIPGGRGQLWVRGDLQVWVPEARYVDLPDDKGLLDAGTVRLLKGSALSRGDGSFGGPGLDVDVADGRPFVDSVRPGSPAAVAGIRVGDQLLSVDGRRVSDWGRNAIQYVLGGKLGSTVRIELQAANGSPQALELARVSDGR